MPDFMDHVQEAQLREQERMVQARTRQLDGLTECAECGEGITPLRTAMGARLCLDCQRGLEAREAHIAGWAQRR